jgi:hypothetical protein
VYGQDSSIKWKKGLFRMGCIIKVESGCENLGVVVRRNKYWGGGCGIGDKSQILHIWTP